MCAGHCASCYKNAMTAAEFRQTEEGKRLGVYIELLNEIVERCSIFIRNKLVALNTLDTLNSNALPIKLNLLLQLII